MRQGVSAVCTAALVLALCAAAAAQPRAGDPEVVVRPEWSLGDWWEYRNTNGTFRWRLTVVAKRADGYTVAQSRVGEVIHDGTGRQTYLFDRDGHLTANVNAAGTSTDAGDKREYVKFPLAVGNRWFFHAMTTQVGKPPTEFYMYDFDCRAESWETLDIGGRPVRAIRIAVASGQRLGTRASNQTVWYAPDAKRIVRIASTYAGGPSVNMIAFGTAAAAPPVVVAAPPLPPTMVAVDLRGPPGAQVKVNNDLHALDAKGELTLQLAPGIYHIEATKDGFKGSRETLTLAPGQARTQTTLAMTALPPTPPRIVVLDPKPGTLHRTEQATLRIEVTSAKRLRSLLVRGRGPEQTLTPDAAAKVGEPWITDIRIALAEGNNVLRLEAVDELGTRAVETLSVARESLVAVEFEGPSQAIVRIDQDQHTLDPNGRLTLQLRPGRYQVEVKKDGFIPLRQALSLLPGMAKVVQKLALIQVVAPTITVLDPPPGVVQPAADVRLRIEVKSRYRLNTFRLGRDGERSPQTFTPPSAAKAGEAWIVDAVVALNEGDNSFKLEAIDEYGVHGGHGFTITRRSLITLDLRGPPGAQVKVDDALHSLNAQGDLALQLPPGTYQIDAAKDGFKPSRETVTLAPGQARTRKTLTLTPTPPAPAVVSTPLDAEPPKIAINYPSSDARVAADTIVILGLVSDNVAVDRVQITVNGAELPKPRDLTVVGRGVPIRATAALLPGANVIEITASDKAGNVSQFVRTVNRLVPAVPIAKVANRWAVVIGIGEYEKRSIPALRYATRDADAIYQFLTTQGGYPKENVLLLTDASPQKPTLLNIKRALGDFLPRRAGRDDMVLIYFAGHGAPEIDAGGTEADGLSKYLIPRDGDPESLYTTALPMDEIQRIFARVQAERIVMLLDTCYSGNAGGRTFARATVRASGLNDQFLERLTRSRGRVIITASGPNEVALEMPNLRHGLFTYHVLEGLKGKADRNDDGIVTVSELYEYVEGQVDTAARRAGGRQRPLMKGEIEGTLPLSKVAR